jgi:hypothetical protein
MQLGVLTTTGTGLPVSAQCSNFAAVCFVLPVLPFWGSPPLGSARLLFFKYGMWCTAEWRLVAAWVGCGCVPPAGVTGAWCAVVALAFQAGCVTTGSAIAGGGVLLPCVFWRSCVCLWRHLCLLL